MNILWKKILSAAAALALAVSCVDLFPGNISCITAADEYENSEIPAKSEEQVNSVSYSVDTNDELFYDYMLSMAFESLSEELQNDFDSRSEPAYNASGISARSFLKGNDLKAYDYLIEEIKKIAAGERHSTIIEFSPEEIGGSGCCGPWTAQELGLSSDDWNAALVALDNKAKAFKFNFSKVVGALLADCPYDLYWFDKTTSYSYKAFDSYSRYSVGNQYYYKLNGDSKLTLRVSKDYSETGETGTTTTRNDLALVKTAVANAADIITEFSEKSGYDLLKCYKDKICSITDYDHSAPRTTTQPGKNYGDPWQLVYVFDGDVSTKVVCEGYSKAFKYLCDLSAARLPNISCNIATGIAYFRYSSGGHMWNIVNMEDNRSYLIDVTNCDNGSTWDDDLFMKKAVSGSIDSGYYVNDVDIFVYDDKTKANFSTDVLTLSTTDYVKQTVEDKSTVIGTYAKTGSEIGLDFIFYVPSALVGAGAEAVLTGPEGDYIYILYGRDKDSQDRYTLTYNMSAARIDCTVSIEIKDSNGNTLPLYDQNGAQYSNNTCSDSVIDSLTRLELQAQAQSDAAMVRLLKAEKNISAYAQKYLTGSTEITAQALPDISADTVQQYGLKTSGSAPDGFSIVGMSLVLDSRFKARLYFTVDGGTASHSFSLSEGKYSIHEENGMCYLEVEGIYGYSLDRELVFVIDDYVITFSPMTYVYNVLKSGTDDDLVNLAKAVYEYGMAAREYYCV